MARIRQLNWYQRGILILLLAMALVFAVVYHMTIARVGVLYQNAIFVPAEENGVTVYSGKLRGKQAEFTVSADKTVSFRCDGQTYGPYTVKEDPTARPDLEIRLETGAELWEETRSYFAADSGNPTVLSGCAMRTEAWISICRPMSSKTV